MSEDAVQRLMGLHDIAADLHADTLKDHNTGGEVVAAAAARSTLESALREALMPAGWRPIAEAPKDEEVLVWFGPAVGVKSAVYTDPHGDDIWFWCVTDGKFDPHPVRRYCAPYPTHWMPLPAAPAFPVELEQPEQPLGVSPQAGPRSPSQAPPIADATRTLWACKREADLASRCESHCGADECVTATFKYPAADIRAKVASDLKALLKSAVITQADAAVALGISEAAMSARLNGNANLTLESIGQVAAIAGAQFECTFKRGVAAPEAHARVTAKELYEACAAEFSEDGVPWSRCRLKPEFRNYAVIVNAWMEHLRARDRSAKHQDAQRLGPEGAEPGAACGTRPTNSSGE